MTGEMTGEVADGVADGVFGGAAEWKRPESAGRAVLRAMSGLC